MTDKSSEMTGVKDLSRGLSGNCFATSEARSQASKYFPFAASASICGIAAQALWVLCDRHSATLTDTAINDMAPAARYHRRGGGFATLSITGSNE